MNDFLDRFSNLLKKKGLTKKQVFSDLNISIQSFYDWEKNNSLPKAETIVKMSEYLNVSCDYLLTGKDNMFQSEPVTKEQIKGALNYAIDQLFETK